MSEKAIDEKKAALEAAKYAFFQDVNFIRHPAYVQAPDGWKYYADEPSSHWLSAEAFEAEQLEDMVNKAHAHFMREQHYAALLQFANEVAFGIFIGNDQLKAKTLMLLKKQAREILGKDKP